MPAAVAGGSGDFGHVRQRQRIVAPLAGTVVRAVMSPPVDGDPGAGSTPKDHGEYDAVTGARTVRRLRGREAIGVVGGADLAAECGAQVVLDAAAVQPGRRRALRDPRLWVQRARQADAQRAGSTSLLLHPWDEVGDDGQTAVVV